MRRVELLAHSHRGARRLHGGALTSGPGVWRGPGPLRVVGIA